MARKKESEITPDERLERIRKAVQTEKTIRLSEIHKKGFKLDFNEDGNLIGWDKIRKGESIPETIKSTKTAAEKLEEIREIINDEKVVKVEDLKKIGFTFDLNSDGSIKNVSFTDKETTTKKPKKKKDSPK